MRTTLTIDDALLRALRRRAAELGVPLKEVVDRVLRAGLLGLERPPRKGRYRGRAFRLGGARVDLDKALAAAGDLEAEEIVRKVSLRK